MERRIPVTCLAAAALLGLGATASAQDVEVSTPDTHVAVEAGQFVDVPLLIVNRDTTASPEVHLILTGTPGNYTFEQQSAPACGPIGPSSVYSTWTEFAIAPIPAGATRTCTIRVHRDPAEINNVHIDWFIQESDSWVYFQLGTFVDIGVTATDVGTSIGGDGTIHATFRLDIRNDGAIDADNVIVGLGPTCVPPPIVVDTSLPGGCTAESIPCGFGGGPGAGVRMPVIPARASQSCLVRFTAPAGVDPHVQAYLVTDAIMNPATGGTMGDDDSSDDRPLLDLRPNGGPAAFLAPTLSPWSILALVLVLIAAGAGFRRARG